MNTLSLAAAIAAALCKHHQDERTCVDCVVESVFRIPMTPIADIMGTKLHRIEEAAHV
jgi:hypothetical protein